MEIWRFCPDANGRPQYKVYVEDKNILSNILKLSGAKQSATYSNGHLTPVAWDIIIPANRLKALYKLTGIKKQEIKFI